MKKSVAFRTVCYGVAALCMGVKALSDSGVLEKAKEVRIPKINFRKQKEEIKENPIIKQAVENVYYAECFRHGGTN